MRRYPTSGEAVGGNSWGTPLPRSRGSSAEGIEGVLPSLEGFGAGPAYTKGQTLLFVGDLTGQVRFAPLRGRFLKEIWT